MLASTVIIIIIAYFAVLFSLAHFAGRKADSAGFFIGNRKSKWYMVAFAMIGSTISGVTFMSVPGMVDPKGFSYMQMILGFFVGQLIIALQTQAFFHLRIPRQALWSAQLQDRRVVFFYIQNAWRVRASVSGLSFLTNVGFWTAQSTIFAQCCRYGGFGVALHAARRCENLDLDWFSENLHINHVVSSYHLFHC